MKKLKEFLLNYRWFSVALLAVIIGILLQLAGFRAAAHWLIGTVAILQLYPLFRGMWHTLRSGNFGIDVLAATAIIASVILGQYWAAIVVVLMLTGGEALENYAQRRAKSELDSLLKHAPRTARVLRKGKTIQVPVGQIHVGDKIIIKAGEVVAVDAVIIDGTASFDEASLTGESLPQSKEKGEQILSGSVNIDGAVTAKATATADESQYQQIIKLVRGASANQARFVRLADRYSLPFTVVAYAIASTVWILTGDAMRFLEVIIVATPCPLLLAAPIAVTSGMARASRYGIIVKTGSALERLAAAKTIAFDKTGTLTSGILSVDRVQTFGSFTKDEVLSLAASLEQNSNHVVAQAVVTAAQVQKIKFTRAKHVQEISGRGLRAKLKNQDILVGRLSMLQEDGVTLPGKFNSKDVTKTAVYLAVNGKLAGVITFSDEIRPETVATLNRLRQLGIKNMAMVTGDNQTTANTIAKQLGIETVQADALPADKLHFLDTVKQRPLIFVGDGVNDAPVLTASDVGIALGAKGSTAASESADMVVMLNDLGRVAGGVEIAKRTFSIARQSIFIGIGLSLMLMGVFATGKFSPLSGAIVQEVVDVVVIINALRAHMITPSAIE